MVKRMAPCSPRAISKRRKYKQTDICPSKCVLDLPNEILGKIGRYLEEYDLFWNFGFTCQRFRDVAIDAVKIIDLCECQKLTNIKIARNHLYRLLKRDELVQSIRHIWICSELDDDIRTALKCVLQDSREKHNILVIDYRLFTNFTSSKIGEKITRLESLLMPKKHRSMNRLTNRSIRNIISSCTKLEWIDLRDCTEFDFFSNRNIVAMIGDSCKDLECILLSRCTFTNESIKMVFRNCNKLEMVIMNDCPCVNDEALITLGENCNLMKLICVDDCSNVSDLSISVIANRCIEMEEFSLRNTKVTGISVEAIANNNTELRVLNLRNCSINSKAIELIAQNCRKLENLDITRVSGRMSLNCLKLLANNCSDLKKIHLGFRNLAHDMSGVLERRLFSLSWSIESHWRAENCPHCYPLVKREAPVIAREIGLQLGQLCLEGFVVNQNSTVFHCYKHE